MQNVGQLSSSLLRTAQAKALCVLQDVRQVWENCFKFNKKDTFVGKVGSKADEKFEQLWAGSGYDQGGRRRRVTGGVAAHRYEPDLLEAEPNASLPRRTSSGGRSSRRVSPDSLLIRNVADPKGQVLVRICFNIPARDMNLAAAGY